MEAIRKQASRLRDQVAKQQQAILRQLRHLGNEALAVDDAEKADGDKAALHFGTSYGSMEDERDTMLGLLGDQVSGPLRAFISGAPLEDARHLTHRYDGLRQEVEAQAAELIRQQTKCSDPTSESATKLKNAESRLTELKSSMMVLGREATAAMLAVEDQQQQTTLEKLLTMVDAERSYHRNIISILEKLHAEMILEEQPNASLYQSATGQRDVHVPPSHEDIILDGSNGKGEADQSGIYFIAKVIHSFDAQTDGELNLEVDDYVVVHQVAPHGWSEGECKGKVGWFPSAYVQRQEKTSAPILHQE